MSLTLYLCSSTAEVRPQDPLRGLRCRTVKTKQGVLTFGPDQPRMWEVAYRLGTTLRAAAAAPRRHAEGGTHASPRAHIRKAHWHSFWTGPKAKLLQPGDRKLVLRWLPPVPVNVDDEHEVIPTAHPVQT